MSRIRMAKQNSGLRHRYTWPRNVGLSSAQLRQAQAVVEAHIQEIEDAWNRHFGS